MLGSSPDLATVESNNEVLKELENSQPKKQKMDIGTDLCKIKVERKTNVLEDLPAQCGTLSAERQLHSFTFRVPPIEAKENDLVTEECVVSDIKSVAELKHEPVDHATAQQADDTASSTPVTAAATPISEQGQNEFVTEELVEDPSESGSEEPSEADKTLVIGDHDHQLPDGEILDQQLLKETSEKFDTSLHVATQPVPFMELSSWNEIVDRFHEKFTDEYQRDEITMHLNFWRAKVKEEIAKCEIRKEWLSRLSFSHTTWYVLVEYLAKSCVDLGLRRRTFHLAVTLLQNFLSVLTNGTGGAKKTIILDEAQLLAAAVLFTCIKYEEQTPHAIDVIVTFYHYKAHDPEYYYIREIVREMELELFERINVKTTTAYDFLLLYHQNEVLLLSDIKESESVLKLEVCNGDLLREICILDVLVGCGEFVTVAPSALAAIVLYCRANKTPGRTDENLCIITGYTRRNLLELLRLVDDRFRIVFNEVQPDVRSDLNFQSLLVLGSNDMANYVWFEQFNDTED
ncbi:hypothetical protein HK098_004779 [Nowakowskiella sp. JEL0407]|nr:hypothetical protein HK098_004779 [Nowakowskiella sp. JEL0407]